MSIYAPAPFAPYTPIEERPEKLKKILEVERVVHLAVLVFSCYAALTAWASPEEKSRTAYQIGSSLFALYTIIAAFAVRSFRGHAKVERLPLQKGLSKVAATALLVASGANMASATGFGINYLAAAIAASHVAAGVISYVLNNKRSYRYYSLEMTTLLGLGMLCGRLVDLPKPSNNAAMKNLSLTCLKALQMTPEAFIQAPCRFLAPDSVCAPGKYQNFKVSGYMELPKIFRESVAVTNLSQGISIDLRDVPGLSEGAKALAETYPKYLVGLIESFGFAYSQFRPPLAPANVTVSYQLSEIEGQPKYVEIRNGDAFFAHSVKMCSESAFFNGHRFGSIDMTTDPQVWTLINFTHCINSKGPIKALQKEYVALRIDSGKRNNMAVTWGVGLMIHSFACSLILKFCR